MHTDVEPFVDADQIAALLGESRRNVLRMAREGKITAYLMSGVQRHCVAVVEMTMLPGIEFNLSTIVEPGRDPASGAMDSTVARSRLATPRDLAGAVN